jgi:tryptophan halogenase
MSESIPSQPDRALKRIVIVGGGTAGWMCAAALAKRLPAGQTDVILVESDEIGTIGVGEATIPSILTFNGLLGIDENDFIRETQATFKLGIEFVDWANLDERYFHPFGTFGRETPEFKFHQLWLRLMQSRTETSERPLADDLGDYNLCTVAARMGRFSRPAGRADSIGSSMRYAFHFDASLYARFLRRFSEAKGVSRVEGKIVDVRQRTEDGFIESVVLEDGRTIDGDLFVDCSGFRGLLIDKALGSPFEDWSKYLPCDRAWAVPSELAGPPSPFTRSTADKSGWRWRIPLQHRMGNGYVYCSEFLDDEEARARLLATLEGAPLAEPRAIRFRTGHRPKPWVKNCVSIGLSSGFIEPLESTSIHLIQMGIVRLILLFPDLDFAQADIDEYNRGSTRDFQNIRDFIVLHYKATKRDDTPFWKRCRDMDIPDTLRHRIDLFRSKGRLFRFQDELFADDSWLAVMVGQHIMPQGYDLLVDKLPLADIEKHLNLLKTGIFKTAESLPLHETFLADIKARSPSAAA